MRLSMTSYTNPTKRMFIGFGLVIGIAVSIGATIAFTIWLAIVIGVIATFTFYIVLSFIFMCYLVGKSLHESFKR